MIEAIQLTMNFKQQTENDFRQSALWQQSRLLILDVFNITRTFPGGSENEIKHRMQVLAVTVTSNILKGDQNDHPPASNHCFKKVEASLDDLKLVMQEALKKGYMAYTTYEQLNTAVVQIRKSLEITNRNQ
ncbi:MAG: four helix bundle protein [Caldithrix sp.]|nr:four helix bundle protein [Caldithrix sp.]